MEAIDSSMSMASLSLSSTSSVEPKTPKTPELPSSILRLWKPQAHRNLRNQWSKLSSLRQQWQSSSSSARAHATSFVNSLLSHRYMDAMDLGVLSDMPNIRKKACSKLFKQMELQRKQLLSSYKSMVGVVIDMMNLSKSMRCFLKTSSGSSVLQFSKNSEDGDDDGDGGGAPVVTFLSISAFEMMAEELVEMFKQELALKRLLIVELLSHSCREVEELTQLSWTDDLYHGEADDLNLCSLYSKDTAEPSLPKLSGWNSKTSIAESPKDPNQDVFQVYLTTWLAEVNIDAFRIEEIFVTVGEELRTSFA